MFRFFIKQFILPFYKANAGFFLFFFFLFFGAVQAGSFVNYHRQLMLSFLQSYVIMTGACTCWILYYRKTFRFCVGMINSKEGSFLYLLQLLPLPKRLFYFLLLHYCLFAPVAVYIIAVVGFAWKKGYFLQGSILLLFLVILSIIAVFVYNRKIINWNKKAEAGLSIKRTKPLSFLLLVFYYFWFEQRWLYLALKALSLILLFIGMNWNRDTFTNDSFLLLFQLIVYAHVILAFKAFSFVNGKLVFLRSLPLYSRFTAGIYLIAYLLLFIPELCYLLINATHAIPGYYLIFYFLIAVMTLFLVTAILYSENTNTNEMVKVLFMLFFVSSIALHAEQFVIWLMIIAIIAALLFHTGFYKYEYTSVPDKKP